MRRVFVTVVSIMVFIQLASADDKPIDFRQLPKVAQDFVAAYFPAVKVSFASVDDDFISPDYSVVLSDGTKIDFENSGALDKIEVRSGSVPDAVIPVQILNYVKAHYPDSRIVEYEVGKRAYKVELSNRLELKFNSNFHIMEIDD